MTDFIDQNAFDAYVNALIAQHLADNQDTVVPPQGKPIHVTDYGMVTGNQTTNDTAMDEILQRAYIENRPIDLGAGHYFFNDPVNFNKYGNLNPLTGITVRGYGEGITTLTCHDTETEAAFSLKQDGGLPPSQGVPAIQVYGELQHFGMHSSNVGGVVFQVGQDDFSDQINELEINVAYNHTTGGAGSMGARFNAVYGSDVNINGVLKTDFNGNDPSLIDDGTVSLQLRRTAFTKFKMAIGGAEVGLDFNQTGGSPFDQGFTYANQFSGTIEITDTAVNLNNPLASANQFNAATYGYTKTGFNDLAGYNNLVLCANQNPILSNAEFIRRPPNGLGGGLTLIDNGRIIGKKNSRQVFNPSEGGTIIIPAGTERVIFTHQEPLENLTIVIEDMYQEGSMILSSNQPINNITWSNAQMFVPAPTSQDQSFSSMATNGPQTIEIVYYLFHAGKFIFFPIYF